MLGKKAILGIVVVALIGLLLASQTISQPAQRGGQRGGAQQGQRGQRGGPGGTRGQFDPERMRQMMDQRMRETLGATEAEWKVLGPRVNKVMELSRQTRGGGRGGMMFGGRGGFAGRGGPGGGRPGGPGGGTPGAPAREQSAVEKAQTQLRTVLDNTASTPDQIKTQLTALRTAREKAKQQLAAAQQDLRKIITIRQEAVLVMMGTLD